MAVTDTTVTTTSTTTRLKPYIETDRMEIMRVGLVGLLVGLVVPLLGVAITNGLIGPIFCHANTNTFNICSSGGVVGYHTAAVIVALAVVALFANWGVFRPLPLVLAATIAMWGFKKFVDPLTSGSWMEYCAFSIILTSLCYLLFYWLLRLRNFPLSIILTIIATVLVCWALVA
jgi:hypothetical protein